MVGELKNVSELAQVVALLVLLLVAQEENVQRVAHFLGVNVLACQLPAALKKEV